MDPILTSNAPPPHPPPHSPHPSGLGHNNSSWTVSSTQAYSGRPRDAVQPFPSGFCCSLHDMDYVPSCGPKLRLSGKQWSTGTVHRPHNVLVQTHHSVISPSCLLGYRSLSLLRSRNWHRTLNLSYNPKPQYRVSNLCLFLRPVYPHCIRVHECGGTGEERAGREKHYFLF